MVLSYIDWERNGVLVLNLTGKITLGSATQLFRQLISDAVALGKKNILLNLNEVVYIDSSGLGEMVHAKQTVAQAGGDLKLVNLLPRTRELMQLTKLYTVFEIYDGEDAALRSF